MDDFEVRAKSTTVLQSSPLVDELSRQAQQYKSFPVIINGFVRTFHRVDGGYDSNANQHLVKLTQRHDHMADPLPETQSAVYELHLDDSFLLYVEDYHRFESEEQTTLCLGVRDYNQQEHSMREQMGQPMANIVDEEKEESELW